MTQGRLLAGPLRNTVELERGDFIRFPGDTPHVYAAIGGSARAAIAMNYPAGSLPEDPSAVFRTPAEPATGGSAQIAEALRAVLDRVEAPLGTASLDHL